MIVRTVLSLLSALAISAGLTGNVVAQSTESASTNILRNPTGGYTQRSVEIPPGSRILFISGQTATAANGETPPDAETQADIVYAKVGQTLREAGMDWSDVVKTNLYMVNPSDIGAIIKAGAKHNPGGTQAGTLVYVKALAYPDVLLELEAVAAKKD
ncbi:MAG: RidA family protein [Rhodospirillales bacterium]|jgi:enamine deaminase RidA (YjgF/YER057c/UK114 family)